MAGATTSTPAGTPQLVHDWIAQARGKLARGITEQDLAQLEAAVTGRFLQRVLYMHTAMPTPTSHVHAMYFVEPVAGGGNIELSVDYKFAYNTPHEAVMDGWQIIQFPAYRYPIQDREIDVQGYQFVLQKWEIYRD